MKEQENIELKPCPFCGGKAEVKTYYEYGKARGKFAFCSKCNITQEHPYSSTKNAINAWNKRKKDNKSVIKEVIDYIDKQFENQHFDSRWILSNGKEESCDVGYAYEWWRFFKHDLIKIMESRK